MFWSYMQFQQVDISHKEITIFNTDAKLTIIEKLQNTKLRKESITKLLKIHEKFWIKN